MSRVQNNRILKLVGGLRSLRKFVVSQARAEPYNSAAFQLPADWSTQMHDPEKSPETLLSVPSEHEAAMIVSALAAHEVDATTSGEFTAGFRAEAPGQVNILVRRCDLERARQVLSELTGRQPTRPALADAAAPTSEPAARMNLGIVLVVLVGIGLLLRCQ